VTITNPHLEPQALDVLNAFLTRVKNRVVRKRLEAVYALHPRRWRALEPDLFWNLDWQEEWSLWPEGAEQKLARHLDKPAWLFSPEGANASRNLSDVLISESGNLIVVPNVCDLVCNYDGGMAINWLSSSKR
jgi:hypothetical protein